MSQDTILASQKLGVAKYRSLVLLSVAFFALVIILSGYTFFMSQRIADATKELELSAQQTVLVQRLARNLLDLNLHLQTAQAQSVAQQDQQLSVVQDNIPVELLSQTAIYQLDALKAETQEFTQVLTALKSGGTVTDALGQEVTVKAIDSAYLQKVLTDIEVIWTPYLGLLDSFAKESKNGVIAKQTSDYLVDYTRLYSSALQAETADFTSYRNGLIQNSANQLKMVQIGGISLAFLLFLAIIFGSLRQLLQADEKLAIAQRQTTNILGTVQEGLFLIDKNFVISDAHSKNLEVILGRKDIAGITLTDLLQGMVGRDDVEAAKLFVEQLYNPWVVSDLIGDLNPLRQIKVNVTNEQGDTVVKYLSFSFLRVQESENDEVEEIFVSVVDVTDSVLLEKTLESEKAQHDRQIEMIGHILNVDINVLNQFINNTYERVSEMNEILRVEGQLHNKAQALFRKMHSLKGEASAIKMGSFVRLAEQGEENLAFIRNQSTVSGQDFLGFTVILNEILDLNQFVEKLLQRISSVAKEIAPEPVTTSNDVVVQEDVAKPFSSSERERLHEYFSDYADQIAERQGKKVKVNLTGFEDIHMTEKLKKFCQDVGIQLLKNAIVHGIETPDVRVQAGKSDVGKITLMLLKYGNQLRMSMIDDGAGVDLQKLRQKAVEMNLMSAEQASSLPDSRLYALMFRSGVSTANGVDEDSGRGVGMDIVREWVKEVNGKINVESQPGLNTKIIINFDAL
ncbi:MULTISPECIES: ATP-binding protein [Moraxella]|uniref:Chemotaxis protein CheA n=2 Tax=Moraxella lacunata TaxID=477 RepID=A0A1B8Q5T4_MORLA|nr:MULTISPECIES: ATP-binding protein [Moraxella]MBE9578684.1 Hpt domain-containing protein [Moraxella sp. K1664]MBE9587016.1 Hpt domain-containing protein [Moraxella sp. K1630]MBE9595254.1 Hpt domain-containing protein [Moraxella sp. K2450]MDH9219507.1 ATP-binding protein [Moraxella lacunata]MDI4482275.1 ATP-binding protein [Moraxella lacunata]